MGKGKSCRKKFLSFSCPPIARMKDQHDKNHRAQFLICLIVVISYFYYNPPPPPPPPPLLRDIEAAVVCARTGLHLHHMGLQAFSSFLLSSSPTLALALMKKGQFSDHAITVRGFLDSR